MTLRERHAGICQRISEGVEYMKAMLAKADDEQRDLTEQEETDYTFLDNEVERLKKEEQRVAKLINDDEEANRPQRQVRTYIVPDQTPKEWTNLGEFVWATRFKPNDPRLLEDVERREQSMGEGAKGGFMVPTKFLPTIQQVDPQEAVFRPRCSVIEAGDPPDTAVSLPVLDQTPGSNMYGGMDVVWIAEGGTKSDTDMDLKEVTLTPQEVAASTILTDKLLRNWQGASSLVETLLRRAVIAAEENAFMSGTGVGRPLGVTQSPCRIDYSRATANQIAYADVYNMLARLKMGGSPVWIASQTVIPQLVAMADAGSHSVWIPGSTQPAGATQSIPMTLMGYPLIFHDRSPALGSTGDLMLVDLQYYLIKNGSGPFVASSEHVHFTTNKTVIKIFWNVDGQPWLSEPIQLEGSSSSSDTVSPFVVLK